MIYSLIGRSSDVITIIKWIWKIQIDGESCLCSLSVDMMSEPSSFREWIMVFFPRYGRFIGSNFRTQLSLNFKEVGDVNEHFCELKQCQQNNWIQKMDLVDHLYSFFIT